MIAVQGLVGYEFVGSSCPKETLLSITFYKDWRTEAISCSCGIQTAAHTSHIVS